MSRVYTSKPAVSRQAGGNKLKNPDTTATKSKTGSAQQTDRPLALLPPLPKVRTYQRMSGPGYSGGAYGGARPRPVGAPQQSLYGRQRTTQSRPDQSGYSPPRNEMGLEMEGQDQGSPPDAERRLEYRGGYSVIPPDEKRKRQVEAQARKEAEAHERYKAQNKPGRVSYVGTAGGGLTEEQARARAAKIQSQAKFNSIQKSQQYRDEKRKREEMQFAEKKALARQQSDLNERRERERQRDLDQDRRMKNDQWLRKFEEK